MAEHSTPLSEPRLYQIKGCIRFQSICFFLIHRLNPGSDNYHHLFPTLLLPIILPALLAHVTNALLLTPRCKRGGEWNYRKLSPKVIFYSFHTMYKLEKSLRSLITYFFSLLTLFFLSTILMDCTFFAILH